MENDTRNSLWIMQKGTTTMFIAEILGTGILLFVGCMGSLGTMGPILPPPLQTSMAFGMTVNLLIMMLGHISGAHMNPAVTIGAVILGIKTIPTGIVYTIGQFIGATVGYGLLMTITPPELFNDGSNSTMGHCVTAIHPGISITQAILIEVLCTSFILCAACATWDPRCAHTTDSTAIRFGFSVVGISLAASPYTGCSMNPARTFGPAFWNGNWKDQWVYWFGPTVGAFLGTYTYVFLFAEKKEDMQNERIELLEMKSVKSSRYEDDVNSIKGKNIKEENLEFIPHKEENNA
ncbi:PREDICTED: aquaporin AQPAe.a-like isoform X2 [Eufriesea mexicana]|uniref:aquaporin AQPAe.a-like isoform X2 n=1 Tax=Eufriesea mexicana TaxID=516756 RepID=UPI00083C4D0C|nr:PREDICTED: aquaporin AQPAe.a-like isoform X2 [Eufriesea mexicana]